MISIPAARPRARQLAVRQEYFLAAQRVVDDLEPRFPRPVQPSFTRGRAWPGSATPRRSRTITNRLCKAQAAKPHVSSGDVDRGSGVDRRLDEVDKRFGTTILAAWGEAAREWQEFANREFPGRRAIRFE